MSAVRGGRWSSRDGLNARSQQLAEEGRHVSVNIDQNIDLLRGDLMKLKQVGQAIHEESNMQRQMMDNLEFAMERARGAMKTVRKKLDRVYDQSKSNQLLWVLLFALAIFFLVYSYKKAARWLRWAH